MNSDGLIDVGQCVGSCIKAHPESNHVSFDYRPRKFKKKIYEESDLTCVPKKIEILKTQFQLGEQLVVGPNINGLVVTDCGCPRYFNCN